MTGSVSTKHHCDQLLGGTCDCMGERPGQCHSWNCVCDIRWFGRASVDTRAGSRSPRLKNHRVACLWYTLCNRGKRVVIDARLVWTNVFVSTDAVVVVEAARSGESHPRMLISNGFGSHTVAA